MSIDRPADSRAFQKARFRLHLVDAIAERSEREQFKRVIAEVKAAAEAVDNLTAIEIAPGVDRFELAEGVHIDALRSKRLEGCKAAMFTSPSGTVHSYSGGVEFHGPEVRRERYILRDGFIKNEFALFDSSGERVNSWTHISL